MKQKKQIRIHITGASGSGTTTLGSHLSKKYGIDHLDTDDFYWEPTDPPFLKKRTVEDRLKLLRDALSKKSSWVLTGSLNGWGDPLLHLFDLVIFLYLPPEVRLHRLIDRENKLFGAEANAPGGHRHDQFKIFVNWARKYDEGGFTTDEKGRHEVGRTKENHEKWLNKIEVPVLRLEGDLSVDERLEKIEEYFRS